MNKLSESVKKLWKIVFSFFLLSFRLLYNVQYMWSYPGSGSGWKLLIRIPLALPLWKPWTSFFFFYPLNYFIYVLYSVLHKCICGPIQDPDPDESSQSGSPLALPLWKPWTSFFSWLWPGWGGWRRSPAVRQTCLVIPNQTTCFENQCVNSVKPQH